MALLDTLKDVPYEQFEWVFNILYWGVVHGTRAFLPMVRARGGTVANMGSIHSFIAAPNNGPYCAAKSAVRGFCDALREEVRADGVHVLLIMPGGIRTEIVRNSKVNKFINAGASQEDVHRAHNAASLTSPEQAAEIILRAIRERRPRVLVGWDAVLYDGLTRLMPSTAHRIYAWGARKMAAGRCRYGGRAQPRRQDACNHQHSHARPTRSASLHSRFGFHCCGSSKSLGTGCGAGCISRAGGTSGLPGNSDEDTRSVGDSSRISHPPANAR